MKRLEAKPEDKKKKEEFKIKVTFERNGKSFQEIAESILLRKINEN